MGPFLIFLIVIGGTIGFFHAPPGRNLIFSRIQAMLETRYGLHIEAGALHYNLFSLTVSIDSLKIDTDNVHFPFEHVFVEHIRVNTGIRTILSGMLHFQNIQIDHPYVIFRPPVPDKAPEKPPTSSKPLHIRVDNLNLKQGHIEYKDQSLPVYADLSRIRIDAVYDPVDQRHTGLFSTEKGRLSFQENHLAVDHILIPFHFDKKSIEIQDFQLESPALTLKASGMIDEFQTLPVFDLRFSAAIQPKALSETLNLNQSFQGTVLLQGTLYSTAGGPGLEGSLSAENFAASGIPPSAIRAEFTYEPSRLALNQFQLQNRWGELEAEGTWFPDAEKTSRINLNWNKLLPGRILSQMTSQPLPLTAESRGRIQAEWTRMDSAHLHAALEAEFGSFSDSRSKSDVSGRLNAEWDRGTAVIHPSGLSFPGGEFNLNGRMDPKEVIQAKIGLKVRDLSRLFAHIPQKKLPDPVNGELDFSADVKGSLSQPEISVDIKSKDISFRHISVSQLTAAIAYGQNTVSIRKFLIQTREGEIQINGKIDAAAPEFSLGESTLLELSVSNFALAPVFMSFLPELPVQGQLKGTGSLAGLLREPQINLSFTAAPLSVSGENIDALSIEGSYHPKQISLNQLNVIKNGASLAGSGMWRPGPETFELDIGGKGIRLQDFGSFFQKPHSFSGQIDFDINARGLLGRPEGRLNLALSNGRVGKVRIGDIFLEAQADGETLTADLRAGDKSIQIQSRTPLENPQQLLVKADINQWNIGEHLPPKPGKQGPMPPFSTRINASAEISIPLDELQFISGEFQMSSLGFEYRGVQFTLSQPLSLNAGKGLITIRDTVFSGPHTELRISGRIPISGTPQAGISLSGKLNLNAFEPFIPGAHLAGTIDLKTSVSGSLQNPELNGNIRLKEMEAGYNGLPLSLEKMEGHIILDSRMVRLENFSAGIGKGEIKAEGRFNIPGFNSTESAIENNRFALQWTGLNPEAFDRFLPPEYSGRLQGEISGSAIASGDFSRLDSISVEGRFNRFKMELTPFQLAAEKDILFSMSNNRFFLQSLHLTGSQSSIQVEGSLDLNQEIPRIKGSLAVSLDGGALSPLIESMLLSGTAGLDLSFQGPLKNPAVSGTGSLRKGYIQLQALPLTISNLEGDINFSDSKISIPSLEASANGGPVTMTGEIEYPHFNLETAQLDLDFRQLQWNYPKGLNSFNRGNLSLQFSAGEWILSGVFQIQQAYFKKDIYIGTELINQIRLNRVRMQTEMPDFLKQLNLDIRINTENEVFIDNNIAELGLNANLVIQGNPIDPAVSGLISSPFSGEIIFGEQTFQVETAHIDFPGGDILDARVNIKAHTSAWDAQDLLEITLAVSGPLTDLSTTLTSFPSRSEVELASLLITGRNIQDLKSGTANIIGNQLLLYFATPLASTVTGQVEDWLKAEEVRIEPINIATEEDPGARFTFRKRLIRNVDLIYSVDITDTQDQTWIMEYDLSRNFIIRAFRKDDGSYGSSLEHRFGLGKPGYVRPREKDAVRRNTLQTVRFSGDFGFQETELRKELGPLKSGQIFNYSDLQAAGERLKKYYSKRNYLNAVINPRISYGEENNIQIEIHIDSGKPVFFDYRGDKISNGLKQALRRSWNGRIPETARISEASQLILNQLKGKGYYQAKVNHRMKSNAARIQHSFTITRGPRFEIGLFAVEGGGAVTKKEIRKTIENLPGSKEFGMWNLVRSFPQIQKQLEKIYEENGYMNTRIHAPRVKVKSSSRKIDITLSIDQGEQSRLEHLGFQGLKNFTPEQLKESLNLVPGQVFRPSQLAMDINHLIDRYRSLGFQDIEINAGLEYNKDNSDVRLIYTISEGIVHYIQDIVITGNRRTPEKIIRREIVFQEGDPVVQAHLVESQKNLFDLNIFDLVNIRRNKIPDMPGKEQVVVNVREKPHFFLGYGLRYNSDDKLEVFSDLKFNNLLGRSRNGILFFRRNQREKNFRFSLTDPYFLGLPINTLHSFFLSNEERFGVATDEFGYTAEQQLQLPFSLSFSYLYRLSHIHTYDLELSGPFAYDFNLWLSELSAHLIRDTRSDKLNARTGSFFSLSLTYSPEFLGSTFSYIRGFGQYSLFLPLSDKLTWASNVRIGLSDTFDQTIMISSKRFFAGGGNSIRGFERDQVGPYSRYLDRPDGGEALFILNQELRFPIYKGFRGVAFFDAGNVYRYIEDFKPWDLRTSAGVGLRFSSPIGLLRLDYGFNLAPEDREPHAVLFFSIGQAF